MPDAVAGNAAGLAIRLFGKGSISAPGAAQRAQTRPRTLALLAAIILRRGHPVSRDFLAFTLYPDVDEAMALATLRRNLLRLNNALPSQLGDPWLIFDARTVRWNADAGAFVDVFEFERLICEPATQAEAIDLYTGDLLDRVNEEWILPERVRLRSLYAQGLADLFARYRSERDHVAALRCADRLLAIEPGREDVLRQAMAHHYAVGDLPGALARYDRFAVMLRAEMGIEPMPETVALREAILRGEPVIGALESPAQMQAVRRSLRTLPFVGRERERERIVAQWDRAARGLGSLAVVAGEAGVGKTRFLGELAVTAEAQGGRVYAGGTSSPESSPYQCIVEALRAALPVLVATQIDPLTLAVLSRLLPQLRKHLGDLPEIAALQPEREASRLFASLVTAIERLASPRPLLLILEDLHWAAAATIDALAAIARRIDRARVLIVVTFREEEAPSAHPVRALVDALGAERRISEIDLERFSRDEVAQLLATVDTVRNDDALAQRLFAFSEGNALFLNEAIAHVVETAEISGAILPLRGIGDVVAARTGALGADARLVAEVAAVCGEGCNVDAVREVAGLSTAATLRAFDELLDRRLLREDHVRDRFDYVFTHHLIGDSIYEHLDGAMRIARHMRIASVLRELMPRRRGVVRELAQHYDAANMLDQAAFWYSRAAREAAAVYANGDAVHLATLAIERHGNSSSAIDALFVREEANARLGNREAQLRDLDALDRLVESSDLRCRILGRRILVLRSSEDRNAEREAIEALRREACTSGDRYWRGRAACADAQLLVTTAQYDDAKFAASEALAYFETLGTPHDRVEALFPLSEATACTGDYDEAAAIVGRARSFADEVGDRAMAAEVLMQYATILLVCDQNERMLSPSQQALELYRNIGDRVGEARALTNIATAAIRLRHWEQARTANLAAVQTLETIADRRGLARALWNLAMLHLRCGDCKSASELLIRAQENYERLGDPRGRTACLINRSTVAQVEGRAHNSKELAQAALDAALQTQHAMHQLAALANLGAAERDLGELAAAVIHIEQSLGMQRQLGVPPDPADVCDCALARMLEGEHKEAVDLAREVLDFDRAALDKTLFPMYPPWVAACILHWNGEDERAEEALQWASELAKSGSAAIDVPELRACFDALSINASIANARAGRWPLMPSIPSDLLSK